MSSHLYTAVPCTPVISLLDILYLPSPRLATYFHWPSDIYPVRSTELNVSLWTESGYEPDDTQRFITAYNLATSSTNIALKPRLPGALALM